ncbi:NUDIX hydrolase [Anaerolentibacter hominis]|uniref:NUDIX hydrolase n=1 Tax=Anaerolentibacter hominis TaxID=3079009 RepID=UPI0031B8456F
MELFDLLDERGAKTGYKKEREAVHRDGDRHGTVHIWLTRRNQDTGRHELLLQKRSSEKDAFPGCYDISSAGHIQAGDEPLPSALRELEEELGIVASPEELRLVFVYEDYINTFFHGKPFVNLEWSYVYLLELDVNPAELKLQEEEVSAVKWMACTELEREIKTGNPDYCVSEEEFFRLMEYLK